MTMQRDISKTMSYFKSYTESKIRRNADLRHTVAGINDDEHRARLLYVIYKNELELWIAKYSAGVDISALKNDFRKVIDALDAYQKQPGSEPMNLNVLEKYIPPLWLISIAYLVNADDHLFNRIVALINQNNKDGVFDQLVKLRRPEHPAVNNILHPQPYLTLYKALFAEGEEQKQLILHFIKTYYTSIKDVYWMDIDPEQGNYFGRWLFELAAFVKGGLLDDRIFVHNPHYPKDLV